MGRAARDERREPVLGALVLGEAADSERTRRQSFGDEDIAVFVHRDALAGESLKHPALGRIVRRDARGHLVVAGVPDPDVDWVLTGKISS